MINTKPVVLVALSALTAFGGCSGSKASDPTVALATVAPTTIAATTTVPAPTTLPADQVFLRSDGIGPFSFGAPYEGFEEGIVLEEDSNDGGRFPVIAGTAPSRPTTQRGRLRTLVLARSVGTMA